MEPHFPSKGTDRRFNMWRIRKRIGVHPVKEISFYIGVFVSRDNLPRFTAHRSTQIRFAWHLGSIHSNRGKYHSLKQQVKPRILAKPLEAIYLHFIMHIPHYIFAIYPSPKIVHFPQ